MNGSDIDRVQAYLRRLLGSERVRIIAPAKAGLAVEIAVQDEVIGTIYKDVEEGETSYSIQITVLEEDLPQLKTPTVPGRRTRH
jgi:hypothetical protein